MLVNFHNIIDTITSAYLIYGDQIFVQTHCSNIFELIMFTYRMN